MANLQALKSRTNAAREKGRHDTPEPGTADLKIQRARGKIVRDTSSVSGANVMVAEILRVYCVARTLTSDVRLHLGKEVFDIGDADQIEVT
jgi:hypothetical protein